MTPPKSATNGHLALTLTRRLFADGAGHEDERQERKFFADDLQRVQPREVRQAIVGDHQIPFSLGQHPDKFAAVAGVADLRDQPVRFQQVAHQQCVGRIIFQMQDAETLIHSEKISVKPATSTPWNLYQHKRAARRRNVKNGWIQCGFSSL